VILAACARAFGPAIDNLEAASAIGRAHHLTQRPTAAERPHGHRRHLLEGAWLTEANELLCWKLSPSSCESSSAPTGGLHEHVAGSRCQSAIDVAGRG
jgi:hypothetical protein